MLSSLRGARKVTAETGSYTKWGEADLPTTESAPGAVRFTQLISLRKLYENNNPIPQGLPQQAAQLPHPTALRKYGSI